MKQNIEKIGNVSINKRFYKETWMQCKKHYHIWIIEIGI